MVDYQNRKVEIFTGINDAVIPPSSTSGGNISHLYNLFNSLIDLLEGDISTLESSAQIDYSSDITALQNADVNLQQSIDTNANGVAANLNTLSQNSTSIGTINTTLGTLTTSTGSIQTSLGALQQRVDDAEADIETLFNDLGVVVQPLASGTTIYVDLDNGSDTNDGLTSQTPFLTLSRLYDLIFSTDIPELLIINIKGLIQETLNFQFLTTTVQAKGKENRAKIVITTTTLGDLIFFHNDILVKTNQFYPMIIEFVNCNFLAADGSLNIINDRSFFKFSPPCNFDPTAVNSESIFYFENTDVEFNTFGSDLIFNNSVGASLECAIKLVKSQGKFEKCTVNNITTFVIAEETSFIINDFNSNDLTNVSVMYNLKTNSFLRTNRYGIFNDGSIILDGSSTINNFVKYDKTLINPSLVNTTKLLNNARKDYYINFTGVSGFYSGLSYDLRVDSTPIASNNYKLDKGSDLNISFSGTTSIESITITLELHDFV